MTWHEVGTIIGALSGLVALSTALWTRLRVADTQVRLAVLEAHRDELRRRLEKVECKPLRYKGDAD